MSLSIRLADSRIAHSGVLKKKIVCKRKSTRNSNPRFVNLRFSYFGFGASLFVILALLTVILTDRRTDASGRGISGSQSNAQFGVNRQGLTIDRDHLPNQRPQAPCDKLVTVNADSTVPGSGSVFQMLAFGDSIMWGNGLREDHKFSTLVQQWLATGGNRPVRLRVFAHSGASAVSPANTPTPEFAISHGDVSYDFPTVTDQVACVATRPQAYNINPADVQLILMDGCANDVGLEKIPAESPDWIRNQASNKCGEPMHDLLTKTASWFPRAHIVVTGYYQLISAFTDFSTARAVLDSIFGPIVGHVFTASWVQEQAIAKSASFAYYSDVSLKAAVAGANESTKSPRYPQGRLTYVSVYDTSFEPHAISTKESYVWSVLQRDEVASRRIPLCEQVWANDDGKKALCRNNAAIHPNPSGAQHYAQEIQRALMLRNPWVKPNAIVRVEPDSQFKVGEPVTFAVHTYDVNRRPLTGRVWIDDKDRGAVGEKLQYVFTLRPDKGGLHGHSQLMAANRVFVKLDNNEYENPTVPLDLHMPQLSISVQIDPPRFKPLQTVKVTVSARDVDTGKLIQRGQVIKDSKGGTNQSLGWLNQAFAYTFPIIPQKGPVAEDIGESRLSWIERLFDGWWVVVDGYSDTPVRQ